jgi:hypothetical protein
MVQGDPAAFVTFGLRHPLPRKSLNRRYQSASGGLLRQDCQDFHVLPSTGLRLDGHKAFDVA